ncbi:class-II fumarase/aspartase family protein [Prauserella cavernicola]|uniref:Adenylosuccinate lyase family protein n=1 Tax=Prauserella cavernicola TaxID=2800127 RepID=A0A934V4B4_9PSEU|nr:adenylosuccinate lyase family protein [Prauserella cavernicola]MBK1783940.1 adenylosuccinate lyase family protein [Prauserella cavernicola]
MIPQRFEMLLELYGDERTTEILSEQAMIGSWLRVEAALATAQGELGVLGAAEATAIVEAATPDNIDSERLWKETRTVGYPILSLVRQIDGALPEQRRGRVHYGATTQDIMDSGLALQLDDTARRLLELLTRLGDALAELAERHVHTVIAGRTHALHAVPTTFGAKLAPYVAELTRHRDRLAAARERVAVVSLFGAGGTSAAYGEQAPAVRARVAELLGLSGTDVPWHVARDGLAEFGLVCCLLSATCARFAREVVDLSRTEIAEVSEASGHHRGASSTMPQKANPIESEAVIGLSATAGALGSALFRAMEAGHERAAGEWQAEWQVLPQLAALGAAALRTTTSIVEGLQVFPDAMRANLDADGGLVMAEAYMMRLAPSLGRERAHDVVYEAVRRCRVSGEPLADILRESLPADCAEITPDTYVGDPQRTVEAAVSAWREH